MGFHPSNPATADDIPPIAPPQGTPLVTMPTVNPPIPGGPTIMGTQRPDDFNIYGIQPQGGFAGQSYWNAYANQNPPPPGFMYSNTGNLIPIEQGR